MHSPFLQFSPPWLPNFHLLLWPFSTPNPGFLIPCGIVPIRCPVVPSSSVLLKVNCFSPRCTPFPFTLFCQWLHWALKPGGEGRTDRGTPAEDIGALSWSTWAEAVQHSGELPGGGTSLPLGSPLPLPKHTSLGMVCVTGILWLLKEPHSFLLGLVLWELRT